MRIIKESEIFYTEPDGLYYKNITGENGQYSALTAECESLYDEDGELLEDEHGNFIDKPQEEWDWKPIYLTRWEVEKLVGTKYFRTEQEAAKEETED